MNCNFPILELYMGENILKMVIYIKLNISQLCGTLYGYLNLQERSKGICHEEKNSG